MDWNKVFKGLTRILSKIVALLYNTMKKFLASCKEKLNWFCKRWDERCVRPRSSGWFRDIRNRQYPSEEVRRAFRIGGEENRQITFFERWFMYPLLIRTYFDLLYGYQKIRKMTIKRAVDVEKFEYSELELVEKYIFIKSILLVVLLCVQMSQLLKWLIGVIICWEVIGLLVYPLTVVFIDRYRYDEKEKPPYCYWAPHSFNRSLLLLLWGYIEMIIAFAYLYRHFGLVRYADCGKPVTGVLEALYFSVVTITTLGYGDMRPTPGWGRFLACVQPIMGIILLVLVVGFFFVELGKKKDEQNNK